MNPETIETDLIRLRLLRDGDLDDLVRACNDPLVRRLLPQLPRPYTPSDAIWWVTEGAPACWAGGGAAYAIADPSTDRLLGAVEISQVIPARRQAEIGYWVAPWARGRKVATAATTALAGQAISGGFARLELLTEVENLASQRVALAAGFRYEGVRRGVGTDPTGERHDLLVWSRLDNSPGPVARVLPDLPDGHLTDGVVTLRPLAAADVDFIHELHNVPDVVATRVPPVAPERAATDARCRRLASSWLLGERADLVILHAASGTPVGEIGLYYQRPQTRQGMIGYSMHPAWRGRGYPTRAARLLTRWAFEEVGVHRLTAGTLPENIGSQRVLEKVGFRREGLLRGGLPGKGNKRADEVLFGLLPEDLGKMDPARRTVAFDAPDQSQSCFSRAMMP